MKQMPRFSSAFVGSGLDSSSAAERNAAPASADLPSFRYALPMPMYARYFASYFASDDAISKWRTASS